jgi:hypothetical protein
MQVPGEDQVERPSRNPVGDPREVADEESQRCIGVHELVRACSRRSIRLGVDPDDGDPHAAEDESFELVPEQPRLLEVAELGRARERIARDRDVVVAQHDEGMIEERDERAQARLTTGMGDKVSSDAYEIRATPRDPRRGLLARGVATGQWSAEVEVRQMPDPEPVQRLWEPAERHLEHAPSEPAGFEPAVDGAGEEHACDDQEDEEHPGTLETPGHRTHYSPYMGREVAAVSRGAFVAWIGAIVAVVLVQSGVHLAVVLGSDRIDTLVDLDRSNGLPDIASTVALAAAAAAAISVSCDERGRRGVAAAALGITLGGLTLADVVHDGPHPASPVGWVVMSGVLAAGVLLAVLAGSATRRTRITVAAATCLLVASFLVNGLDQYDQRFERERGDSLREYEIVAKEGLELLGWSLVALALWDAALRRRPTRIATATARASRAQAASTRRAA